jgi:hypothetical protein
VTIYSPLFASVRVGSVRVWSGLGLVRVRSVQFGSFMFLGHCSMGTDSLRVHFANAVSARALLLPHVVEQSLHSVGNVVMW